MKPKSVLSCHIIISKTNFYILLLTETIYIELR